MISASNSLKTPYALSINEFAEKKVSDAIQQLGKALPCSVVSRAGAIVTVSFEVDATPWTLPQVTVPIGGAEYIRLPIRPGCTGLVFPADVRIGGISGLGAGLPKVADRPGNLAALTFFPIGNKNWTAVADDALVLYSDLSGCKVSITPSGVEVTGSSPNFTSAGQIEGATLKADNGYSGTFATQPSKTITVVNGIITSVV